MGHSQGIRSSIGRAVVTGIAAVGIAISACPVSAYAADAFDDVHQGDWYYAAANFVSEHKIMSGYGGQRTFGPNDPLTREQAATVLYNYLGNEYKARSAEYMDVSESTSVWYVNPVNWAASSGVMTGYDNGYFGVGDALTREQLASIMASVCQADVKSAYSGKFNAFQDATTTSSWAQSSVIWAVDKGIINGYNNRDGTKSLDPHGTVTRAQMAAVMMNAINNGLIKDVSPINKANLVGTWKGTRTSSRIVAQRSAFGKCFGGSEQGYEPILTITDYVSLTNKVKGTLTYCLHDHDIPVNDQDTTAGDRMVTYSITGSFGYGEYETGGSFTYQMDPWGNESVNGQQPSVTAEFWLRDVDTKKPEVTLTLTERHPFRWSNGAFGVDRYTDEYTFKKVG